MGTRSTIYFKKTATLFVASISNLMAILMVLVLNWPDFLMELLWSMGLIRVRVIS